MARERLIEPWRKVAVASLLGWRELHVEDAWEVAKEEWAGLLTLDMLTSLRAHGRIEGMPAEGRS